FLVALLAFLFGASGRFLGFGIFVLLSGFCDFIDGQYARGSNQKTTFGAFLDSTLDRYSDFFFFASLIIAFADGTHRVMLVVTLFATIGTGVLSYIRARALSLGWDLPYGYFQRESRIVLLGGAGVLSLFTPLILFLVLWVLALGTNASVFQMISGLKAKVEAPHSQ
ncbi:MAG: CDP-alcohol phosphatidyltransferase family protein, partial [Nitrospinota bacterium]